jgi:hypothetical protein
MGVDKSSAMACIAGRYISTANGATAVSIASKIASERIEGADMVFPISVIEMNATMHVTVYAVFYIGINYTLF